MQLDKMGTRYESKTVEDRLYLAWESKGIFQPEAVSSKPKYTITIPPPNITGSLHMGHSLCYPVQDCLARFHRLQGFNVLVVPGQDHAGIATQSVVAKNLLAQGISPNEIGREKFVEHAWEWRGQSGDMILEGFRKLGCSFDWSKSRFTLDEGYVNAVLSVFIEWFESGLIYRGKRIVNWDPVLKTSVSDIETERKTLNGKLYHVRYPIEGSGEVLIVATTRPETMFGDVAIAVHPQDERYKHLHGKNVCHPLTGNLIPVLPDPYPDPEFGTGAVKVTPAHDANDYEIGQRHGLDMPVILDDSAKVIYPGEFFGLDRYAARKKVVAKLEEDGFMEKVEDHSIPVIVSDRSKEVIEPLLSEQWFVKQTALAEPAMKAVESGELKFIPERYSKVYTDWLEGIRDWCISRQLWWGHRIPVYYDEENQPYAAHSWDEAQEKASQSGKTILRQDDDVLDTWFSSGLWPFAVLGWPGASAELNERYPTSCLVTDRGIIYLWVARMVMMGLYFKKQVPFKEVYIHATVLNENRQRMSKSLGTGVDPLPVIEEVGADALRFTLLGQAGMNQEIVYSSKRNTESRNFCNKIWNASRFILSQIGENRPPQVEVSAPEDLWILSRLARMESEAKSAYQNYDFMHAANSAQDFFWYELCDSYLEITKARFQNDVDTAACRYVLHECLRTFLIVLHPVMPFITDEVFSFLPNVEVNTFIVEQSWPSEVAKYKNQDAEDRVERWLDLVRALRSLRADLSIDPRKSIPKAYFEGDLAGGESVLASQAWVEVLEQGVPSGPHLSSTTLGVDLHIEMAAENTEMLREKFKSELKKVLAEYPKVEMRLLDEAFLSKAKPEIVEKLKADFADLKERRSRLEARLARLA